MYPFPNDCYSALYADISLTFISSKSISSEQMWSIQNDKSS